MSATPIAATERLARLAVAVGDLRRLHLEQGRVLDRLAADLVQAAGTSTNGLASLNGHMAVMATAPNGSDSMPASTHVAAPTPNALVIDRNELCRMLGIQPRTLRRKVDAGVVPAPFRIGKKPVWRRADIERWLAEEQTG